MGLFEQAVLFTSKECEDILKLHSSFPSDGFIKQSTSSYEWTTMDKTEDGWILDRFINWVNNHIDGVVNWDSNKGKDEFYFQTYKKGDKFEKHTDSGHDRAYTIGLLLNDKFKGGNFVVDIAPDNSVLFKNVIGNCYIIESNLAHELKEITEGERHIVLVFFKNSQIKFSERLNELQKLI